MLSSLCKCVSVPKWFALPCLPLIFQRALDAGESRFFHVPERKLLCHVTLTTAEHSAWGLLSAAAGLTHVQEITAHFLKCSWFLDLAICQVSVIWIPGGIIPWDKQRLGGNRLFICRWETWLARYKMWDWNWKCVRLELKTALLGWSSAFETLTSGIEGICTLMGKCFEMKFILWLVTETECGDRNFGMFDYLDPPVYRKY